MVGNDDEMERSGWDCSLTTWADVGLAGCIRLNRCDCDFVHRQAKIAHTTTARVTMSATTTIMTSNTVFCCGRNGLSPTLRR